MEKIYKGEIKRLLPIFKAMADGKTIQFATNGNSWIDIDGDEEGLFLDTLIATLQSYSIKPEPKCRPFKDAEECWKEMEKHQPFGWVKDKKDGHHALITAVDDDTCGMSLNGNAAWSLSGIMDLFTFADGTPFEPYSIMIGEKESPDIDPSTICQFTGLKYCEGNEIWEGDILEGESKSEIVYNKGTFAISFIGYNKRVFSYPLCYYIKEDETVDGKVVGNKFDKKK